VHDSLSSYREFGVIVLAIKTVSKKKNVKFVDLPEKFRSSVEQIYDQIQSYFSGPVRLTHECSTEADGANHVSVVVWTHIEPEEAIECMKKFDHMRWSGALSNVAEDISVHVDFEAPIKD
jgi:hypothetical protein